jgi:integrase
MSKSKLFRVVSSSNFAASNWCVIGAPHGKRERYYFKNKSDAVAAANDKNAELMAHGNGAMPDGLRVEAAACVKRLAEYDKSLTDAVNFYVEYLKKATSSVQVAQFIQIINAEFERRVEAQEIGKLHFDSMRQALNKFGGVFGDRPVKTVTGNEVKEWIGSLELNTTSRNKLFRYVHGGFIIAREKGLVDADPLDGIKKFTVNKQLVRGSSPLTPEESVALINASCEEIRPLVLLGLFAGIRFEERTKMTWDMIGANEIDLPAAISKTGKRRLIRIEPNLAEWLKSSRQESGPIIESRAIAQKLFGQALKDSKIEDYHQGACRDSYCSYGYESFGPAITAKYAGHSEQMLTSKYQRCVSADAAAKFWAIKPGKDGQAAIE